MRSLGWALVVVFMVGLSTSAFAQGLGPPDRSRCLAGPHPVISFVQFASIDLSKSPPAPLTVKAKLQRPVEFNLPLQCFVAKENAPAVIIFHGSSGVDSRGSFYSDALLAAGIATFEPDLWEARGVMGLNNRPAAPIYTYPDVFAALRFLSAQGDVDPARIGILGFSWGGVMALGSAEQLYAARFGGGLRFKAHVANYPVCYGANNPRIVYPASPAAAGTQFLNHTGAPMLIQIGTEDDYDNGAEHCQALAASVNTTGPISVEVYEGAYHGFDRLMVPVVAPDPFGNEGSIVTTGQVPLVDIRPDVDQAFRSRHKVVRFFQQHL